MTLTTRQVSTMKAGLPEPVPHAWCVLRDSHARMFMFAEVLDRVGAKLSMSLAYK